MDYGTMHNLKVFAKKQDLEKGYLKHIENQAAIELYPKVSDGKIYAVRITRIIGDIQPQDCVNYDEYRYRKEDLQEQFVSIRFDISKAQEMNIVVPVYPDYSKLLAFPLAVTALDEIKQRISRFFKGKR
jgi:hypothetical protein